MEGRSNSMKKARVFIINGVPKNAKEIADELKCSVVTVFNFYRDFPGHTDTENFRRLKEKLKKKNFVEGYCWSYHGSCRI